MEPIIEGKVTIGREEEKLINLIEYSFYMTKYVKSWGINRTQKMYAIWFDVTPEVVLAGISKKDEKEFIARHRGITLKIALINVIKNIAL